jgi:hypothetical protein
MYANMAHYLYTNIVAKPGSDTSVLLLSYGRCPHLSFSWRVIVAVSSPPHTRSLTRFSINRHCPNGSIYSSASTSRSSSPTPVDNLLGVNHPDWRQLSRRQPDRCPSSTILATLTPIHLSQKSRSRNPCLVPSSLIHGWVSTSRKTRTGQANSWT